MRSRALWPFRGLAGRVAGTLAVALLPIGAIAVYQAVLIAQDEIERRQSALLTATAEAAAGEALAISSATGAVTTLAARVAADGGATPDCSEMFRNVVRDAQQFSFAGFVDREGILRCGSTDVGRDMSDGMVYPVMEERRAPLVLASSFGSISGTAVLVSAAPVYLGTEYVGFVAVSVPQSRIFGIPGSAGVAEDFDVVTFNAQGEVLSSDREYDEIDHILPVGRPLPSLVSNRQFAFSGRSQAGDQRTFAVVPIIPGVVHALGSWPHERMGGWLRLAPVLFPVLMLLVGLAVAFGAVNALVIRYIRKLQRNMQEFARSRRIVPLSTRPWLAQELAEIDEAWTDIATRLLHDEAALENIVHEKNVLLKEVHHRVKNNLQLIASIVNLKIRRATSPEARRSLKEVQMRVMSIAAVHRALYSEPTSGRVRADDLLRSVIDSTISAGLTEERAITIRQSYASVFLYPDQAVPLLLMASEAVTNALKYMGMPATGEATLTIELTVTGEHQALLQVVNTRGKPFLPPDQVLGSGLGQSLIAGFATQVGGSVETIVTDDYYDFRLTFEASVFDPDEQQMDFSQLDAGEPALDGQDRQAAPGDRKAG